MRYAVHELNSGVQFLAQEKPTLLREVLELIAAAPYQIQACGERGRSGVPIFSPSMNNAELWRGLQEKEWLSKVALSNPAPASGRDVDFYKDGVVIEVQFAHYGLLQTDFARMEGLHSGAFSLRDDLPVECGIEVVVNRGMPTSQSVARTDQALGRAAPLARTIPVVIVDLLPPADEDVVVFHEDVVPRARRPGRIRNLTWRDLIRGGV